jgi:uncharacterized SAM-binding protein YcdF (DUF218 family)
VTQENIRRRCDGEISEQLGWLSNVTAKMDIFGQPMVNLGLRHSFSAKDRIRALWARGRRHRLFAARMFWLKKSVSFWLMPVPLCLTLLIVGLVLLCFSKRLRLGRALLIAGTVLFALFSNKLVSYALLRPIEATFPPIPEFVANAPLSPALARCRYVVVLGGGHTDSPGFSANNQLSSSALARIVEGVRILRRLPGARLITTGPGEEGFATHAATLARVAIEFGVARDRIILSESGRDTEEESRNVRALVRNAPVALVTTAWHLPRAVGLFRRAGMDVLPCPTDYLARPTKEFHLSDCDWDTSSLERSTAAVHERLGYAWVWLRRKV